MATNTPALTVYADGVNTLGAANLNTFVQNAVTAANLRSFIGSPGMVAFLQGITAPNDGGGGSFYWNPTSTQADNNTACIKPNGAVYGRWIKVIQGAVLTPKDFGAVGDGVTDDTNAVNAWFSSVISGSLVGFIPAGTYKITGTGLVFDVAPAERQGFTIYGAGGAASVFNVASCTSSPQFLIKNSNFAFAFGASFYGSFRDFGIEGNFAGGVAAQIGQNYVAGGVNGTAATYADAFNGYTFTGLVFANRATAVNANTVGVRFNSVVSSEVRVTSNCGGTGVGTAMECYGLCFCQVNAYVGNAGTGIRMPDGYSFGTTFIANDCEVLNHILVIDSAAGGDNMFLGGTAVWGSTTGNVATTGQDGTTTAILANGAGAQGWIFMGVNWSSGKPSVTGSYANFIWIPQNSIGTLYTGGLAVNPSSGTAVMQLIAPSGGSAYTQYYTTGSGGVQTAYIAGLIGTSYAFQRYNQTNGAYIDTPYYIDATTGRNIFQTPVNAYTGFSVFTATPVTTKPTVTGSKGGNAALASLISALASYGLITDSTT